MDPTTVITVAATAFSVIKSGIAAGRDLQDMGGQLAEWAGAMSDLDFLEQRAKDPPLQKLLTGGVEAEALELFVARRKARAMRKELRVMIQFQCGMGAWDELLAIEAEIRKQRKKAIYAKQRAREQMIEAIVLGCLLVGGAVALTVVAYLVTQ